MNMQMGDNKHAVAWTGEGTRALGGGTRFSAHAKKLHSLAAGCCGPEADQTALFAASTAFGYAHTLTCLSTHGWLAVSA